MKKQYLKLGQFIFGIIVLILFVYAFLHFGEIKKVPQLLLGLRWYYLLALLVIEFLFLLNRGQIFKALYNHLGIPISLKDSSLLFVASSSTSVLTPSAGLSGVALFMSQAESQGTTKTRVLVINFLFYFINCISLGALLVISAIYLFAIHQIKTYFLIGFGILILIILSLLLIIILAFWKPVFFLSMTEKLIKLINFFLHMFKLPEIDREKSLRLMEELDYLRDKFKQDKMLFWEPFLLFLLGNFYEIISLFIIFLAIGVSAPWMMLIAVYSVGLLFMLISITPSGVGIVEPIMAVIFLSSGISLEASALVVLIFRAISFWLPLPLGVWITKKYLH